MTETKNSWIKLTSFGGANTVTGSCHMLTIRNLYGHISNYLIDCGLFQEKSTDAFNENIAGVVGKIDAVFLTHAHVDHSGRIPYLYTLGYRGPIYATESVKELSEILLADSARIQEEAHLRMIKKLNLHKKIICAADIKPLYTERDATLVMDQFVTVTKNKSFRINDNLEVCFFNAGHALGSSSIKFTATNGLETYRIYFSGDIGQNNPILKRRLDFFKKNVDFVIMESTYANREHSQRSISWRALRETVATTILNGGNVIFPAFAVGRTQELLYLYYKDMTENDDWVTNIFKNTPVFVDGMMAIDAMSVFRRFPEEFKQDMVRMLKNKTNNPFNFEQLSFSYTKEDSLKVSAYNKPCIIFSSAGMCNAGRVLYHLENNLENPNSTVIFTGYQAEGTLGRQLVDGSKTVRIHGKTLMVKARISYINGFSAHADKKDLLKWLINIEKGYILFLAHGIPEAQDEFKRLAIEKGILEYAEIELMSLGREYNLYKGGFSVTTIPVEKPHAVKPKENFKLDKNTLFEIERLRELINTLDEEESSIRIVVDSLKKSLSRITSKEHKKDKLQGKPNRCKRIRR